MHAFSRPLVIFLSTFFLTISVTTSANHLSKEEIDKRTQPVGKVTIAAAETATTTEPAAPRSGDVIYNSLCIACHSTGLANAPKAGDSAKWSALMEVGMDSLVDSAKKGKNAMPPMGTCADCTDEELKNAIQFMVDVGN